MRDRLIMRQHGFSLLEVLVAFSIMALSLGILYQAAGGSVRGAAETERQTRAVFLAQSVLAQYASVPHAGVRDEGLQDDLRWRLFSEPWPVAGDPPPRISLQRIVAEIEWSDRGRTHRFVLASIVPEQPRLQ